MNTPVIALSLLTLCLAFTFTFLQDTCMATNVLTATWFLIVVLLIRERPCLPPVAITKEVVETVVQRMDVF